MAPLGWLGNQPWGKDNDLLMDKDKLSTDGVFIQIDVSLWMISIGWLGGTTICGETRRLRCQATKHRDLSLHGISSIMGMTSSSVVGWYASGLAKKQWGGIEQTNSSYQATNDGGIQMSTTTTSKLCISHIIYTLTCTYAESEYSHVLIIDYNYACIYIWYYNMLHDNVK